MFKVTLTTSNGLTATFKSNTNKNILFGHIGYCFIVDHKDNEFLKQFFHGPTGVQMGSSTYKRIAKLEKKYARSYVSDLLGMSVSFERFDGRTSYAKTLHYFNVESLFNLYDNSLLPECNQ